MQISKLQFKIQKVYFIAVDKIIYRIPFAISLIFTFLFLPSTIFSTTLYLVPENQIVYRGDSFIVEVRIDTESEEINAAGVGLTFPANLLEVIDFSKGNSILGLWPQEPQIQEGTIIFLGGTPGGFEGEGLLAKIIFLGKEIGKSKISFKENSQILLNNGKGTPTKLNFSEGNYEIIKKPENLPVISSDSHPDQNKWYNTTTLQLYWDLAEGAEYSYLLSYSPLAEPDEIPDRPEGELMWIGAIAYKELEKDEIYYFTLKQKLPGEDWSETAYYRAMIDKTSPEPFELKIGQDTSIFEGKYFLSFSTKDEMSGIDYYEVKEGKKDWERVMSPYLLKEQSLGQKITIRVYDKAGNYQESEIKPPLKMAWQDWLYIFLILVGIGLIWWLLKRTKK